MKGLLFNWDLNLKPSDFQANALSTVLLENREFKTQLGMIVQRIVASKSQSESNVFIDLKIITIVYFVVSCRYYNLG